MGALETVAEAKAFSGCVLGQERSPRYPKGQGIEGEKRKGVVMVEGS